MSFDSSKDKGTYKGDEEDSTRIVIKWKHEDGDIYDDLKGVVIDAKEILKQESIAISRTGLDEFELA